MSINLVVKERAGAKCELCDCKVTNMSKHILTKKHQNKLLLKNDGDKIKQLIRDILKYRDDIPPISEVIEDCDITDPHDRFVTSAIIGYLKMNDNSFELTNEDIVLDEIECLN